VRSGHLNTATLFERESLLESFRRNENPDFIPLRVVSKPGRPGRSLYPFKIRSQSNPIHYPTLAEIDQIYIVPFKFSNRSWFSIPADHAWTSTSDGQTSSSAPQIFARSSEFAIVALHFILPIRMKDWDDNPLIPNHHDYFLLDIESAIGRYTGNSDRWRFWKIWREDQFLTWRYDR
jgi:hypothetical protein